MPWLALEGSGPSGAEALEIPPFMCRSGAKLGRCAARPGLGPDRRTYSAVTRFSVSSVERGRCVLQRACLLKKASVLSGTKSRRSRSSSRNDEFGVTRLVVVWGHAAGVVRVAPSPASRHQSGPWRCSDYRGIFAGSPDVW